MALFPNGEEVLQGNWDSKLRLWDVAAGKQLREFQVTQGRFTQRTAGIRSSVKG